MRDEEHLTSCRQALQGRYELKRVRPEDWWGVRTDAEIRAQVLKQQCL